mmetsp:Transcript_10086/g.31728  ORF Transcript_10086/g.31728 Transcript_10086/m.31728 type:complete len:110 (+) Transcript_10086:793-1122(+)
MKSMVYSIPMEPISDVYESAERFGNRQRGKITKRLIPPSTVLRAQSAAGAPKLWRIAENESATTIENARQEKTVLTVQAQFMLLAQRGPAVAMPRPLKLRLPLASQTRP